MSALCGGVLCRVALLCVFVDIVVVDIVDISLTIMLEIL